MDLWFSPRWQLLYDKNDWKTPYSYVWKAPQMIWFYP